MSLRPDVSYIRCLACGLVVCERETDDDGRGVAWIIRARGALVVRCPSRMTAACSRCGEIRHLPEPREWARGQKAT